MIRFIWQNWWRRKERLLLMFVGALIISVGLTYLVGLAEINKATVVDELQKRWVASYDIVVRPEGSRSITEEEGLLDPNYLSGIKGGISFEQYEKIKQIPNVEVAAPIAVIGYVDSAVKVGHFAHKEPGVYRHKVDEIIKAGLKEEVYTDSSYIYVFEDIEPGFDIYFTKNLLLAGIDPEQEAKLVGLDQAIIPVGGSRYLSDSDSSFKTVSTDFGFETIHYEIPVIVNPYSYTSQRMVHTFEKLDIELNERTEEEIEEKGGYDYLDTIPGKVVESYTITDQEAHKQILDIVSKIDFETGEPLDAEYLSELTGALPVSNIFHEPPGSLQYEPVESPYPDRWPYAYQLQKYSYLTSSGTPRESFREPSVFSQTGDLESFQTIGLQWIGFYDPGKLQISLDPTNELPMETYRPANADLVLDPNNEPLNPPIALEPTNYSIRISTDNFLAHPPTLLTTLEAAEMITGEKPISAIRIKVAGVNDLSEESQERLEEVAKAIEEETGLMTDITLGSSPQPTIVHVPEINEIDELGWISQPWIKQGIAINIFRETKLGFSGLIVSIVAVAVIYVWSSSLVSLLSRRREFSLLAAIGWQPNNLSKLFFTEAMIIGSFVALFSWLVLATVHVASDSSIDPVRFLATGFFGFAIYMLGAIFPALAVRKILPYETLRIGEISKAGKRIVPTRGVFSMVINSFFSKWKRNLLSILTIALPAGMLSVFLYITIRLQGVLYITLLGQFITFEVGPVHYITVIVAFIIAILTTLEITWQNVSERQEEIALLKAIGWRNRNIRFLIWFEGLLSGLFAAIVGFGVAIAILFNLYNDYPMEELPYIIAVGIIPLVIGVLGTILPAERAARILPNQAISGYYTNRRTTERVVRIILIVFTIGLIGTFIYLMFQLLPLFN